MRGERRGVGAPAAGACFVQSSVGPIETIVLDANLKDHVPMQFDCSESPCHVRQSVEPGWIVVEGRACTDDAKPWGHVVHGRAFPLAAWRTHSLLRITWARRLPLSACPATRRRATTTRRASIPDALRTASTVQRRKDAGCDRPATPNGRRAPHARRPPPWRPDGARVRRPCSTAPRRNRARRPRRRPRPFRLRRRR